MARVNEKGISGAIGDLVYYTMNGINYVRAKPVKKEKKKWFDMAPANLHFKLGASFGSMVHTALKEMWGIKGTQSINGKVKGWIKKNLSVYMERDQWPLSANTEQCNLVSDTLFTDCYLGSFDISCDQNKTLTITIPAMNPALMFRESFPAGNCYFRFAAFSSSLIPQFPKETYEMQSVEGSLTINRIDELMPAQSVKLTFKNDLDRHIIVVAALLEIEGKEKNLKRVAALIRMGKIS
jgi:hypothetical protein